MPRPPRRRAPRTPRSLGQRLWALRECLGYTQRALGSRVGVGQAAVSAWEKDLSTPRDHAWPLLEQVLHCTRRVLETGEGFVLPKAPDLVSEPGTTPYGLPPRVPGKVICTGGHPAGGWVAVGVEEAVETLRSAVAAGRPVWVVVAEA